MAFIDEPATITIQLISNAKGSLIFAPVGGVAMEIPATLLTGNLVQPVVVVRARALSPNRVRIDFDGPLDTNSQLLDRENYKITPTAGGAIVTILSVHEPSSASPLFIELEVTEMTDGSAYEAIVNDGSTDPVTSDSVPVTSTPEAFTGLGEIPFVLLVIAASETTAEVRFSETMRAFGDITDPSSYSFDLGLIVEEVLLVSGSTVTLQTSAQNPGTLYTATITGSFEDGSKNPLVVPATSPMLGFVEGLPDPEALNLRMYNFLIQGMRNEDQRVGEQFWERYLEGPQVSWKVTTGVILAIPLLWSVTEIPDEFLRYLKNIVGWTDDLNAITDALDSATLRRLIANSVAFWKTRGNETSTGDLLRLITAERVRIVNWFQLRFIVGETELSQEFEGHDYWITRFRDLARAPVQLLNSIAIVPSGSPYVGTVVSNADGLLLFVSSTGAIGDVLVGGNQALLLSKQTASDGYGEAAVYWYGSVAAGTQYTIFSTDDFFVGQYELGGVRSSHSTIVDLTSFPEGGDEFTSTIHSTQDGETVVVGFIARRAGAYGIYVEESSNVDVLSRSSNSSTIGDVGVLLPHGLVGGVTYGYTAPNESLRPSYSTVLMAMSIPGVDAVPREYTSGDECVYNVRIVDSGDLNRQLVIDLLKLTRPIGERIEVDFIAFLDEFTTPDDNSQWTGNTTIQDGHLTVLTADPETYVSLDRAFDWTNYVFTVRMRWQGDSAAVRFYRSGPDDYYEAQLDVVANTLTLVTVLAGTPTTLATVNLVDFDLALLNDVWYSLRVEASPEGTNAVIKVAIDNNQILVEANPDHANGSFGIVATGTLAELDIAELFLNPLESSRIGLGNVVESNFDL